jgi:fibronectin type 3 domain-containing protein
MEPVIDKRTMENGNSMRYAVGGGRLPANVLLHFAFFILPFAVCQAQQTAIQPPETEAPNALMITGRSTGSSIQLRWAPGSPAVWSRCNETGYMVLRYTVMRNKQLLPWEERSVAVPLTQEPIFPWKTEDEWTPLMERDSFAAIAAQALLGEDFELQSGEESQAALVNRATEANNRFTFGMFAADHSYQAAKALGLAWEDKYVKPNETYVYRVFPAQSFTVGRDTVQMDEGQRIPLEYRTAIDTGFFSISTADKFPLPKILEVQADFGNRTATVSWNKNLFQQFYVSYQVERSADGQMWEPLNNRPLVTLDRPGAPTDYMFVVDSLPMNNRPYFYRVLGRTIFDDFGPPSDPAQGMGIDPLPDYFPYVVSVLESEQGGFIIGWEFNAADEGKILGFKVFRSNTDLGRYECISGDLLLPAFQRAFTDDAPMPVNYYRVSAFDVYNREMSSFSALAQLDDETPPAPPQNVRGAILKDGTTVITWDANTEPDLMGYRVYVGNHPNDEFYQVTSLPVTSNHFIDTVSLNTLSKELYVQVIALDYRQNSSDFSKTGILLRPDTIAPAPPAISDLTADAAGVHLEWANSQSRDVLRHELLRRPKGAAQWETIAALPFTPGQRRSLYSDTTGIVGKDYDYQVVAIDNSDLRGESQSVEARRLDNFIRPAVTALSIEADRRNKYVQLNWKHRDLAAIRLFEVYRAEGDGPLNRYRTYTPQNIVEPTAASTNRKQASAKLHSFSVQDAAVQMNREYRYAVRAIYHDGGMSPLIEEVFEKY